jgi:hypothetical protein
MSPETLLDVTKEIAIELKAEMGQEDIAALKSDLKSLTENGWIKWSGKYFHEAMHIIAATPQKRRRRKLWKNVIHRRRVILLALEHLAAADAVLREIAASWLACERTPREKVALAGLVFWGLYQKEVPLWNLDGKSPFLSDR